jgi:hypothetical protein
MKKSFAVAFAALALAACKPHRDTTLPASRDAIKALGGTVPDPDFDRSYWQKQHDADSAEWREAQRLCGQTVLANYPNCLPVNDIVRADEQKRAEEGKKAAAKNDEMGRRGFGYDYSRKTWLPFRAMQAAGCTMVYPRVGEMTWQCAPGTSIPKGIYDPSFSKEGE